MSQISFPASEWPLRHHPWILVVLAFVVSSVAQDHAPTKEQCFADMKVWLDPMSEGMTEFTQSMNGISAKELGKRRFEMAQCHAVDSAHSQQYDTVSNGYNTTLENRMEDFIRRHPELMDQFLKEDAARGR